MSIDATQAGDQAQRFVLLDGSALRCRACHRPVGRLRWDAAGWPHPVLSRPRCPSCGRQQIVDPNRLEADTLARYGG
jgi:hypothetical protein